MGEEETMANVDDVAVNGANLAEEVEKPVIDKKEKNGAKEMEGDSKDGANEVAKGEVDGEHMDQNTDEVNKGEETEEKEKEELKTEMMKEGLGSIEANPEEDQKDDKIDGSEEKTGGVEESSEEKEEVKESIEEKEEVKESTEDQKRTDNVQESKEEKNESERCTEEVKESIEEKKRTASDHPVQNAVEKSTEEKGSKKRKRVQNTVEKSADKTKKKEEKEQESKTPTASDRPVRERKSVERLVAIIEKDTTRDFHIEKGRGTPLKDIPNVAYKLSRRKGEETFKLLHTILFGRRGKAAETKSNISRFSGFVWHGDEEKQKMKVRERLDKCVKEKLLEICDTLDVHVAKTTTKKEDIVAKLLDFLMAPHDTTSVLLAEKEQPTNGKRHGREGSAPRSRGTSSTSSTKRRKKNNGTSKRDGKKNTSDTEDNSEEEEDETGQEAENGVPERSNDENSAQSESQEKNNESEEETEQAKKSSNKKPSRKQSSGEERNKEIASPKMSTSRAKKTPNRSSSKPSKVSDVDASPKVFSRKKKTDEGAKEKTDEGAKETSSISKRPAPKEKPVKRAVKGREKPRDRKIKPTDDELRTATCEILKEVDFNTATFTDILQQLAKRFNTDLTPQKASIKLMIQDELTKLADEEDEDEEGSGDAKKEEAKPAEQAV